jgi:hypothetical protein
MNRISCLFISIILLQGAVFFSDSSFAQADSPPHGQEYPVVWWAQNHVPQALELFRFTTAESLEASCKSGHMDAPSKVLNAWRSFAKGERKTFCRHYPGQTHHLLGEAPYFMVSPPAVHK